jgi:hypothetical protein
MNNEQEQRFRIGLIANTVLWGIAIIASAIAHPKLVVIMIIGGAIGGTAMMTYMREHQGKQ